jgi:ADP-ribosyl-[dinitrogen reductase] hydrolase
MNKKIIIVFLFLAMIPFALNAGSEKELFKKGRTLANKGDYDQDAFLQDFITYMSTPGQNRDPYCEIYIRAWFESYSKGVAPELCAQKQRTVWSIGSHGGIIRPLVLSILAKEPYQGLGLAISHQQLTHRSENVSSALGILVPLLHALLRGEQPHETISEYAKKTRQIKITGENLSKTYRAHKGPGNIPKDQMWKIHTEYSNQYLDINHILETYSDDEIIGKLFATACYPEHGLPLLLCLLHRNRADFKASLLANANAGGDNVHRGMILGLLAGASNTEIPYELKSGLLAFNELKNEIKDFVNLLSLGNLNT